MDSQIFRPVADWEGSATVQQHGQAHDVWVKVVIVRQMTADADGSEHDNGHLTWTARVTGPVLMVGAEVTVTLSEGQPIGARVLFDQSLLGSGVPSPIDGIRLNSAMPVSSRDGDDRCPKLRAALLVAKRRRDDLIAANARADNEARRWPTSAADLVEARFAVDAAAREARRAGCDLDDLVGPDIGQLA